MPTSPVYPDPPSAGVSALNAWIGRKEAKLRRSKLDCGCPNVAGEVFFHLWCDRLACEKHADSPHVCGEFKGKSSIEDEAVEPEVFPAPLGPPVATGNSSPEGRRQFVADVAAFHAAIVAGSSWPPAVADDVTVMPADQFDDLMATIDEPDEMPALRRAAERRHPTLAEMNAASAAVRARMPWICPRCRTEFSWDLPGLRRLHEANGCEPAEVAPPVDAALQPGPTGDEVADFVEEALGVEVEPWQRALLAANPSLGVPPDPTLPWWRRMLGGGTR